MPKPKVSIVSISYNQQDYIAQALDSFLMQQADFDYEIIIADDCSTDKTASIIAEYYKKYPHIIKPILRKKNIGVAKNLYDALQAARGQYIALCEGDDYWTDPKKIQLQADFLDTHPDYSVTFHPVKVFYENKEQEETIYPDPNQKLELSVAELLRRNYIQTNSVMYRKQAHYNTLPEDILPIDWYLHLYHAQFGRINLINTVMSAYRRHPGGIWWNSNKDIDQIWKKYGIPHLKLYVEFLKLYGGRADYRKIIIKLINDIYGEFLRIDIVRNEGLLRAALPVFPEGGEAMILRQADHIKQTSIQSSIQIKEKELQIENVRAEMAQLEQHLEQKNAETEIKSQELAAIKTSKAWRLVTLYRTMYIRIIKG